MNKKNNTFARPDPDTETFQGSVQKIIFSNEDNGYAVLVICDESTGSEETAVGTLATLNQGETVKFSGRWVNNVRFGRQFKVDYYEIIYPGTEKGIINFLSSGFIHGIGMNYAGKIVEKFGMQTIDILSEEPDRLLEVQGIGAKRLKDISESWEKHRSIRDVMVFLQSFDISAGFASKIHRVYRHRAVEKIRDNPYCLAHDIQGIGFIMADRIARKMGIAKDSPRRAEAGIIYLLTKVMEQGHTYYPLENLSKEASKDLDIPLAVFREAVDKLASLDWIKLVDVTSGEKGVYLTRIYSAETSVASDLGRIKSGVPLLKNIADEKVIRNIEELNRVVFSAGQFQALKSSLEEKLLIITGGPGTGKTTIIKGIVQAFTKVADIAVSWFLKYQT